MISIRLVGRLALLAAVACWSGSIPLLAQETGSWKKQRGTYQPPTLLTGSKLKVPKPVAEWSDNEARPPESMEPQGLKSSIGEGLGEEPAPVIVQVAHVDLPRDPQATRITGAQPVAATPGRVLTPGPVPLIKQTSGAVYYENEPSFDADWDTTCDGTLDASCDAMGCGGCGSCQARIGGGGRGGSDWLLGPGGGIAAGIGAGIGAGMNCGGCGECNTCCSTGFIPLPNANNGCWYGGLEWLHWYRRGQDFPTLAADVTNPAAPVSLFGGQGRLGEDPESGGRVTIGRWLDRYQCQGITFRFWGLDSQSFGFYADNRSPFAVGVPYNDPGTAGNDFFQAIDIPTQPGEFLRIGFDSEVYGGDLTMRQLWVKGLGGRVDFIYGYQYFRLQESLGVELANQRPVVPGGNESIVRSTDRFATTNEFHAAKLGLNIHYDEGPWAFDSLLTMGFGSVNRRAALSGFSSIQTPPGAGVTVDEGSLVRNSNEGVTTDSTFAVSPEVNVSLGYRLNRNLDFTVGYTFLMVTDVLQVYQTIDDTIDLTNNSRPVRDFGHDAYWVQGLNLGVNFNY